MYFSPLSVDSRLTHRPTLDRLSVVRRPIVYRQSAGSRPIGQPTVGWHFPPTFDRQSLARTTVGQLSPDCRRLYDKMGDLESWCWQEKELTVSCTSCEDERNAFCATRKAIEGILGLDSLCQLEWQKLGTRQSAERRPLGNDVIVLFRLSRGYSRDSNRILLCNVFQHFTADRTKITSAASYRFLVLFSETFEQVLTQIQWTSGVWCWSIGRSTYRPTVDWQGAKIHMNRQSSVLYVWLIV